MFIIRIILNIGGLFLWAIKSTHTTMTLKNVPIIQKGSTSYRMW